MILAVVLKVLLPDKANSFDSNFALKCKRVLEKIWSSDILKSLDFQIN
jgi:hypothetical protein